MLKTILVPLDGSTRAEAALPVAVRIAHNTGGTLVLARVVSLATENWPAITAPFPGIAEPVITGELAEASSYLEGVAASEEMAGIQVETATRFGPAASTILAIATSCKADLIVMCSRGYTGMAHHLMGSTAERIARHAPVPVLILRDGDMHAGVSLCESDRPLRVLVPLDGTAYAEASLEPTAALLSALATPERRIVIHLARVIKPPAPADLEEEEYTARCSADLADAKQCLVQTVERVLASELAPTVMQRHIPVNWMVAMDTDVAGAIVRLAENEEDEEGTGAPGKCNMISLSTHGREGVQLWTLGSVTERVLHVTRIPVLVVRPGAAQGTHKTETLLENVHPTV
ncbi:MAG: universal stress protein [Ktedonobacteraceae bacterium]|nr:universal stress protein [Ktedonobacteraceae bacterium]